MNIRHALIVEAAIRFAQSRLGEFGLLPHFAGGGCPTDKELDSICESIRITNEENTMTDEHINWPEAFDKNGFEDGGDSHLTRLVGEYLTGTGYKVKYHDFPLHNSVICSLTGTDGADHCRAMIPVRMSIAAQSSPHEDADDLVEVKVGFDNPLAYLPESLVEQLDARFGRGSV